MCRGLASWGGREGCSWGYLVLKWCVLYGVDFYVDIVKFQYVILKNMFSVC